VHPVTPRKERKVYEQAQVQLRGWKPEDLNFIIDSWASSYRFSPDVVHTPKDVYKIEQRGRIFRLVTKSRIIVANRKGHPDDILGWVCFEPPQQKGELPILHYVLVQRFVQMQGIGKALVQLCRTSGFDATGPIWATHFTAPMRHLHAKWGIMHNDYLLEQPQTPTPQGTTHAAY
jgi:hypothetical protein